MLRFLIQMPSLFILLAFLILIAKTNLSEAAEQASPKHPSKPRLIVLTDIGGDPDDQQSLVRLMYYANEFEIEGLIASASGTPGELKEAVTQPQRIREIVRAYGEVQENLSKHATGYPTADELLKQIKSGNPNRGRKAIGEGQDTEGSRWIIRVVDRDDSRPVNIAIWGGQTDFAQALWRVQKDRGESGLRAFWKKIRVYDIADQDGIFDWMRSVFFQPETRYILNKAPKGADRREAVFRGMYLGGDQSLVSRKWMETHIRTNHGPLGRLYPPRTWTAPSPHSAIKEGDTPSWLYFLPHGLNDPDQPQWGSWGGRFQRDSFGVWRDAQDKVGETKHARATVWRWRAAFQADFQARLDRSKRAVSGEVNKPPNAVLNGNETNAVIQATVKSGETIELSAVGSSDPNEDELQAHWFIYQEAGTFTGRLEIPQASQLKTSFIVPAVSKPETIHIILELRDDGTPNLYAYRRFVLTAVPK